MDIIRTYLGTKGQSGKNSELVSSIRALDIIGWIGFSVPQLLCLFQRGVEIQPIFCHSGEDIIGCAVDNSMNSQNVICQEVSLKRCNQRYAAADAGLIADVSSMLAG